LKSLLFKNKSEIIKPQANKLIETKMNANNNNQTPCANAFADNAPNCVGIVAVGNEHGLCSACETKRQAECREEHWIREYNAKLNMKQAFLTKDEKKQKNTMNKQKQYILQKNTPTTVCECGGCYKKTNTWQHLNTKKHQEYLKKNVAVINNE
jgi:hypothetical protein